MASGKAHELSRVGVVPGVFPQGRLLPWATVNAIPTPSGAPPVLIEESRAGAGMFGRSLADHHLALRQGHVMDETAAHPACLRDGRDRRPGRGWGLHVPGDAWMQRRGRVPIRRRSRAAPPIPSCPTESSPGMVPPGVVRGRPATIRSLCRRPVLPMLPPCGLYRLSAERDRQNTLKTPLKTRFDTLKTPKSAYFRLLPADCSMISGL